MGVWNFNFTASFLHTMMPFPPAAPVFSNVEQWKVGPEKTDCLLVLSRSVVKIKETVSWAHRGWYLAYIRCWMALSSLRAVPGSFWLETMCCSVVSSYFLNTQDKSEQRELIDLTNRLTSWMVNEQMNLDIFNQFSCPSHTSPPGTTFVTEKRKSESASRSVMSWVSATSMDCSPPGSSVHGILQARILEGVAMPSSRGSSLPRDQS